MTLSKIKIHFITAVVFLESWKRKNASLAHHWDVLDYEEEEERPRAQFAALCSIFQKNAVTGVIEPYFPREKRLPRILTGICCILFMVMLILFNMGTSWQMSSDDPCHNIHHRRYNLSSSHSHSNVPKSFVAKECVHICQWHSGTCQSCSNYVFRKGL